MLERSCCPLTAAPWCPCALAATHCQQALGLDSVAVGRLLQHCPAMFSFPAEERAAILFAELMGDRVARTASQAADLFVRCPALGNTKHVLPELVKVVAEHHGALE